MRYLLLVVIVFLNTSFIEVKKSYWIADTIVRVNTTIYTYPVVIEAPDKESANKLYNLFLEKHMVEGEIITSSVEELKKEDILK